MFRTKFVEKIKTHILYSIVFFFRKSCRLWDNVEKYGTARQATDDNIIRRMRFACWITKATDTHTANVILTAFPRQQWLRERASVLLYTYIACLVLFTDKSLVFSTVNWVPYWLGITSCSPGLKGCTKHIIANLHRLHKGTSIVQASALSVLSTTLLITG
jgi:hypothetical protein